MATYGDPIPETTWERVRSLDERLRAIGRHEGGAMWMGKPDRWWADPHWRCTGDHVSDFILKSEAMRASVCLGCYEPVVITFPEDRDGPLVEPQLATLPAVES